MLPRVQTKCVIAIAPEWTEMQCTNNAANSHTVVTAIRMRYWSPLTYSPFRSRRFLNTGSSSKLEGRRSGTSAWSSATTSETVWSRVSISPSRSACRNPPILGTLSTSCRRWIMHWVSIRILVVSAVFQNDISYLQIAWITPSINFACWKYSWRNRQETVWDWVW